MAWLFVAMPATSVKLMLLQRLSDIRTAEADCTLGYSAAKRACYLDDSWKAVAATALQAVKDFNDRRATYVPEFGQLSGCDKTLDVTVYDSGSMGAPSVRALIQALGSARPDAIIGPSRSAASIPTATLAGVEDIPQISYWATSQALDSLSDFPRFMRTIPTDDAVASAICQFWKEDMAYSQAALIYSNDAYGEAYKESLVKHCLTKSVVVTTLPYDAENEAAIRSQVVALARSSIRVVLWVGSQQGLPTVMDEAYVQGLFSPSKGAMWVFSDGASPSAIATVGADRPVDAHTGAIQIIAAGGTDSNPRWTAFASNFSTAVDWAAANALLPAEWQIAPSTFASFDALSNGELRDVGTFEYDAVAMIGLLTCAVAPTGPLPANFGTLIWNARESVQFQGLSGLVQFDALGNRATQTANYVLSNILVSPDGQMSAPRIARYESNSWNWGAGISRADSALVYMGGTSVVPPDVFLPPSDPQLNLLPEGLTLTAQVTTALLLVLVFFFAVWTVVNRDHPLLKASQPLFLCLILLGGATTLASVFPLCMDHRGVAPQSGGADRGVYPSLDTTCNMEVWLFFLGFEISFGSLFAKLWRVKRVLINPKLKSIAISSSSMLGKVAVLVSLKAVLLGAWMATSPMYYRVEIDKLDEHGRVSESHGHCVTDTRGLVFVGALLGQTILLLLYGNVLVYQARNVPTQYHEGKYIAFAVANILQTMLFAVLLGCFVYDTPVAFFIIKWLAVLASDAGTILLIFVPKLVGWVRARRVNTTVSFGAATCGNSAGTPETSLPMSQTYGSGPPAGVDVEAELRAEVDDLRDTIAGLRDQLQQLVAERGTSRNSRTSRSH